MPCERVYFSLSFVEAPVFSLASGDEEAYKRLDGRYKTFMSRIGSR